MTEIRFARGDRRDEKAGAHPSNREACDFDSFERAVLDDRGRTKGTIYIAAPFKVNGNGRPHRGKDEAEPRAWLPFDLDGMRDGEAWADLTLWLQRFRGFAYTTARHTPDVPRLRIVLAASRPVDRTEGMRAGMALETDMKAELGADLAKFDQSVYRGEQPCYTPLVGAQVFRFEGAPVDVDALLAHAPEVREAPGVSDRARAAAERDPILRELIERGMVKRELEAGRFAVACPCASEHTSESTETSTVYMLPNFGGVRYGKFHCLHQHCDGRAQEQFITALGLEPRAAWREQADGGDFEELLKRAGKAEPDDAEPGDADEPALPWLPLAELSRTPAAPPQWAVEGWIPAGGATLISGHGGSGKTALAAQLALCVASGTDFLGLPVRRQRVAFVLAEATQGILLYRMQRAAHALGVRFDRLEAEGWLRVLLADEVPGGLALFGREPQPDDRGRAWIPPTATATVAYKMLRADLKRTRTSALVLDPAADFFDAEEINRRDVRGFIASLRSLVPGPVVLSAHVNRESVKAPRAGQAWSGSTAWHNSARARIELLQPKPLDDDAPTADDGLRLLHLAKNNDGRAGLQIEARLDFERWLFVPTVPTTTDGGLVEAIRRRADSDWLVRFIAEAAGRGDPVHASSRANRNPHARINARDDCPARWRGRQGARSLYAELDRLREAGTIRAEHRTTASRNGVEILLPGAACAS